jgi:hypothetical protein
MPKSRRRLLDERGTAVTETLMLTWIVIVFIAAALQLFRVNQAIYSAVTSAHMQMFNGAWRANCFNKTSRCIYNSDLHAQVRWHPTNMPEVLVESIGMFRQYLIGELRLRAWPGAATPRRDGYKRTRMGAGTYHPICKCAPLIPFGSGCMESLKTVPGMGFC